jgi:TonB family protein
MGMLHTPYPTLDTAPVGMQPPPSRRPVALYTIAGLSLVVGALGVTWGLKGSSKSDTPTAPVVQPLPAAAIPPSAPSRPTEPEKVAVSVESDAPNAHVVFRRRVVSAPMATEIAASEIVELVEVSAPGYKTERYWLTLDRATHLKAHLTKGAGLDEASEEATLTALGEVSQPAIAAAAPAPAPTKVAAAAPAPKETPAPAVAAVKVAPALTPVAAPKETPAPVVAVAKTVDKPTTAARLAPRKIGRSAEAPAAPQVATSDEPRPAFADAPPKEMPAAAPAPTPAPTAVEAPPQPVTSAVARPAVVVSPAAVQPPHNISPAAFRSLRVSGNAEIEAPVTVAKQMVRDSKAKVTAAVKACVSLTGDVTAASLIKSSGYPEYDRVLLEGVRGWKFKSGDAVCSAVTFAFKP